MHLAQHEEQGFIADILSPPAQFKQTFNTKLRQTEKGLLQAFVNQN